MSLSRGVMSKTKHLIDPRQLFRFGIVQVIDTWGTGEPPWESDYVVELGEVLRIVEVGGKDGGWGCGRVGECVSAHGCRFRRMIWRVVLWS